MALGTRPTNDLLRIAAAGGGMRITTMRPIDDLLRIAAAMKSGGGTLYLRGITGWPIEDLLRIAAAGGGHVVFEDEDKAR
jgi:hypothetical protein